MRKPKWLLGLLAVTTVISSCPEVGYACGPFIDEAILSFDRHPDFPFKNYAAGELGIIQPGYAKSYLVVAYRFLANKPLNKNQQEAVYDLWKARVTGNFFDDAANNSGTASNAINNDPSQKWLQCRAKVVNEKNQPSIDVNRRLQNGPDNYDFYVNCTSGSFQSAVKILNEKIAKHGSNSPFIKEWVAAQDKVFAHCAGPEGDFSHPKTKPTEPPFPEIPKEGNDTEVIQDRTYQQAAAYFYAAQFDKALAEFKSISADAKSPYCKIARYMMARCLTRKATLIKMEPAAVKTTLASASSLLHEMLADPSMSELYSACHELLGFVAFRFDANARLIELSNQVLTTDNNVSVRDYFHSVDDYTMLLLNFEGGLDDEYASEKKPKPPLPSVVGNDDLSDWITTWEREDKGKFAHAVEKWHKTKSDAWLLAALHLTALHPAPADKSKTDELLSAAHKVPANNPGYLSINYEAARLLSVRGQNDDAIKETMALKDIAAKKQLWSAVNLLMDLRGKLPIDLAQFDENAVRKAAAYSVFDEYIEEQFVPPNPADKKNYSAYVFGFDNARFVNERMPLSVMVDMCLANKFPKPLQADADQAAWTRAVLLDDSAARTKLVPALQRDYPDMASLIKVAEQGSDADKKFSAAYLILKYPGMRPYMRGGAQRVELFGKLDTYGDNWWTSTAPDQEVTYQDKGNIVRSKLKKDEYPKLLTTAQQTKGVAEQKRILAMDSAPSYLNAVVADYAAKHLTDTRVPEALSLAVRASRYGDKDDKTTAASKKCFQILHNNFPKNPFTKKTPYYY